MNDSIHRIEYHLYNTGEVVLVRDFSFRWYFVFYVFIFFVSTY